MIGYNHINAIQAYGRASETVGDIEAILMVYDTIIKFINQAKEAIERKDIEGRYNAITKACDIFMALRATLDFDAGKESAEALDRFYESQDFRLIDVNFNDSLEICDEVISNIRRVRASWIKAGETLAQDKSRQTISAQFPANNSSSTERPPLALNA